MKYNPKLNERQVQLRGFVDVHPLLPSRLVQGILRVMYELERFLAGITGMDAVSLQPAAGAQGELTGIKLINAWFASRGERRTKFIVPRYGARDKSGEHSVMRLHAGQHQVRRAGGDQPRCGCIRHG